MTTLPARKPRISSKVRAAIELRVRKGLSIEAAANAAGLSRNGLSKALKRPEVDRLLAETQERFVTEVSSQRALLRAHACEVASEMLESTTDDRVRLKLIELLMSDGKAPAVSVNVDARTGSGGYEYLRPGQRLVEIGGDVSSCRMPLHSDDTP